MIGPAAKIVSELVSHPRVGAIGFIFAVGAATLGYTWGNESFATKQQLNTFESAIQTQINQAKRDIVSQVDRKIIRRELRLTEDSIRKITQQISLGLCADPDCRFNKAEKEVLERRVQSLKDELNSP